MSALESWVLSYLLNSLWQVPLLVAAGWVAARGLRPLGAEVEHRVWVSVLVLECGLPAASLLPSGWLRIALPWGGTGAGVGGPGHVAVTMGAGTVLGASGVPMDLLALAALGYAAVTSWLAMRFLWRWARLEVLRRESVPVELAGEAAAQWNICARRFGLEGVALGTSSRIFGPVTIGFARRLVLLPPEMLADLEEPERTTVIAHEFAHIRRNDFLKNLIYELIALPVSYHPLVWLTRERLTESREMICDARAAEQTGNAQYTRSLLRLAGALTGPMPVRLPHTLGIFDTNTLERRLMQLTEKRKAIRGVQRMAMVAACAALGMITCASALAMRMHVNGMAAAADAPAHPHGPIAVRSGIMAGQRISGTVPKYPEEAKKQKIQGTVVLNAVIDKDGSVKELTVESGPKELQKSAVDAVYQWKYKPFLLNGDPVEVKTTVNVIYSLAK